MSTYQDLSGKRYGKLVVIEVCEHDHLSGDIQYKCVCDCDAELPLENRAIHIVRARSLRSGNTKSCGCSRHALRKNYIDITGERFGRYVVLRKHNKTSKDGKTLVECYCDCDIHLPEEKRKIHIVKARNLRTGVIVSCGCYKDEQTGIRSSIINKTHGLSGEPEYYVYNSMIQRCTNPNHNSYMNYGGRGITVCERWSLSNGEGFVNFYNDMGKRPSNNHTLERKDVNENYSLNNCHWAEWDEQGINKTCSIFKDEANYILAFELYHNGKSLTEIAKIFDCSITSIKEVIDGKTYSFHQKNLMKI
jgi:hypothetical protein